MSVSDPSAAVHAAGSAVESAVGAAADAAADTGRRAAVLESAIVTFARFGYRKTAMEEVARSAHISRPGLYFLFDSKEALFRAAVTQTLERDLEAVEHTLAERERPLRERMLEAFDLWAGRYIGPLTGDITVVIDENPALLGEIVETTPRRFEALITAELAAHLDGEHSTRVTHIAQTLISASIGIKHQVTLREHYRERMATAIGLLLG
ncbi:TetR/AcrR family transcriptional regulator [Subtercola lobariae]|uniref:TetR family transcriptional regulator n=1 Tax=Subtercola lobariae TaxID=1588641 RepID=A0A917BAX8_9MICO|nr:TetR/AcrR family transcriptional regulator [Subtercola lobariae]GGF34590.1 TetR family transcriptional regulator [Subtercola lobariae]